MNFYKFNRMLMNRYLSYILIFCRSRFIFLTGKFNWILVYWVFHVYTVGIVDDYWI